MGILIGGLLGLAWFYCWLSGGWFAAILAALFGAFLATHAAGPFSPIMLFGMWILPWCPLAFHQWLKEHRAATL